MKQSYLNGELENIIVLLQGKAYGEARVAIERFINNNKQKALNTDSEIEALKLEAKRLEAEVSSLSNEKADLEKLIHSLSSP